MKNRQNDVLQKNRRIYDSDKLLVQQYEADFFDKLENLIDSKFDQMKKELGVHVPLLTVNEVLEREGISKNTLYRWIKSGLKSYKINGLRRFKSDDLSEFKFKKQSLTY